MKLSLAMPYAGNPRTWGDRVVELEKAGLDMAWVAEAYGFDSPTMLGYLAARTTNIELGAGILNVYSRTPAALLQTAAGLDRLSGGRATIGLGASGPQVIEGFHGVPYTRPIARTRDVITVIRQGLRREVVRIEGTHPIPLPPERGTGLGKPLKLLTEPERPSVPLWLAALGDANVTMTAELAEGWLPFLFIPEKATDVWGAALRAGQRNRSPLLPPLQIAAGGLLRITTNVEQSLDLIRPTYALYVGGMGSRGKNFYHEVACRMGYEGTANKIQDLYLDGHKKEAAAAVPREWLEWGNLVGPPELIRDRIDAFRDSGVTHLHVTPAGPDQPATIASVKEWIS